MTEVVSLHDQRRLCITWPDGSQADYPFIWLRDNCPSAYHPQTQERIFDLLSVPADIAPAQVTLEGSDLAIAWSGETHVSRYPLDWLSAHRPGQPAADPARVERVAWRGNRGKRDFPGAEAAALLADDAALLSWLTATQATGLSIVYGLADDPEAGQAVARRISFLRETNFGVSFEVKSKPNPNNLAYTASELPLHTDLPNQELPPGIQFLHCLANEAVGGGSVFADGYAVTEQLRGSDPEAYRLLSTVSVPFRFHDEAFDIRSRQMVITLDTAGKFSEVCWSNHLADILDLPAELMIDYYRAHRAFMAITRDRQFRVEFALRPGEMAVFDNRRVLHGRAAFDPNTGFRHLQGFYVDRGEFASRIRVLARGVAA